MVGRPFQKGQSGNPGGRPKGLVEIQKLARKHGKDAIKRLVELMRSDDERVSVQASQALLDRGYGKPAQPLDGDGEGGSIRHLHEIAIRAVDP